MICSQKYPEYTIRFSLDTHSKRFFTCFIFFCVLALLLTRGMWSLLLFSCGLWIYSFPLSLISVSSHGNAWPWSHNPTFHLQCCLLSHQHCLKPDSWFWFLPCHSLGSISGTNFNQIIITHLELSTGIILLYSTFILICVWSELGKQLQATFSSNHAIYILFLPVQDLSEPQKPISP